jgi:hypothetical protein
MGAATSRSLGMGRVLRELDGVDSVAEAIACDGTESAVLARWLARCLPVQLPGETLEEAQARDAAVGAAFLANGQPARVLDMLLHSKRQHAVPMTPSAPNQLATEPSDALSSALAAVTLRVRDADGHAVVEVHVGSSTGSTAPATLDVEFTVAPLADSDVLRPGEHVFYVDREGTSRHVMAHHCVVVDVTDMSDADAAAAVAPQVARDLPRFLRRHRVLCVGLEPVPWRQSAPIIANLTHMLTRSRDHEIAPRQLSVVRYIQTPEAIGAEQRVMRALATVGCGCGEWNAATLNCEDLCTWASVGIPFSLQRMRGVLYRGDGLSDGSRRLVDSAGSVHLVDLSALLVDPASSGVAARSLSPAEFVTQLSQLRSVRRGIDSRMAEFEFI